MSETTLKVSSSIQVYVGKRREERVRVGANHSLVHHLLAALSGRFLKIKNKKSTLPFSFLRRCTRSSETPFFGVKIGSDLASAYC